MAKHNTNWQEVADIVRKLVEPMVQTAKPLSYLKAELDKTDIPTITKQKLAKYFKEGINVGALFESCEELNKYFINTIDDDFFKPKTIVDYCRYGRLPISKKEENAPQPETIVEIVTEGAQFALRQEVYFVQDNKFEKGNIAGILFIDTDNLDGLAYIVKFIDKEGNSTTKQMFPEEVFASIADLGNSLIKNFKERNPGYGRIKR